MENNESLELLIKARANEAEAALLSLKKEIASVGAKIKSVQVTANSSGQTQYLVSAMSKYKKINVLMNEQGERLKTTTKDINKMGSSLSSAINLNKFYLLWNLTRNIRHSIGGWFKSAIDFQETVNLFNVSMGSAYKGAERFQNKMAEAYGLARTELMQYQATYKNILSGLGNITTEASEKLSRTLVQISLDYSSMFNVGQEEAMSKIQSALTGSIMPIRKESGFDVSKNAINNKLTDLGIQKSYTELSELEKRIIRIMLLMDQMKNTGAFEDLARTIESPSNQLKVLKNTLQEIGMWLGNAFMGVISTILPYLNGVLMVVKELIKAFAILVGFKMPETSFENAFNNGEISSGGIADNIGQANENAKKLQKTLQGFDVLNVIQSPTENKPSGGSGGGAGVPSIDPSLLDAFSKYDSIMESVQMKATKIRDRIMDWLGFTKEINPLTGEITWKMKEGYTRIEKIIDLLQTIGVIFLSWKIAKGVLNFFSTLSGGLFTDQVIKMKAMGVSLLLGGLFLAYKGISRAIEDKDLTPFNLLQILTGGALTLTGGAAIIGTPLSLRMMSTLGLGIAGITLAYKGIHSALKDGLDGKDLFNIIAGANLTYAAGAFALRQPISLKASLKLSLAVIALSIAWKMTEWWNEYFEEQKKELYGSEKKELNLGELIHVGLSSIGTGAIEDIIEPLFGEDWDKWFNDLIFNITYGLLTISENIETWWTNDVAPWFTKEKWKKLGEDAKNGLEEKLKPLKDNLNAIQEWWDTQIAPWFTKEKWEQEAEKAKSTLEEKFNEFKNDFKPIKEWWDTQIAPWFTWEKWKSLADNGIKSLETKYNEWKNQFNPVSDWWNNKIAPWFTWEKWKALGQNAINALGNAFSNFNFKIKLPHFSWTSTPANGWMADILSALNLPTSLPKLNVSWYARGGMPEIGELFMAREAGPELVGKIGNRNTVMNNDQIVSSVSRGVAQAVQNVLSSRSTSGQINIYLDSDLITDTVIKKMDRNANILGY